MAIGTVYHSNSIPGMMTVGGDIDLYAIDSTQKYALGTQITRQDGCKYRYANFVTATIQGNLVAHVNADTDHISTDALLVAPAVAYQMPDEQPGLYPGAIGSKYLIMTHASMIKDQFAGGYITMNADTGYGYIYRIKGNTASNDPVSGKFRIELYDKLQVAIDATTDSGIVGSLYSDLLVASHATNWVVVGVTMANMTANTFGWICTHGVCTCLQSDTSVAGDVIQLSATVAGAYSSLGIGSTGVSQVIISGGLAIIGYVIQIPASNGTGYGTIYLQLE